MIAWVVWAYQPRFLSFISPPPPRPQTANSGIFTGVSGVGFSVYQVQAGDTYGTLAKKFTLSESTLRSANSANDRSEPLNGMSMMIPIKDGIYHRVLEGQGLADIAKAYGIPLGNLLASNHKKSDSDVRVGEVLCLPGGKYLSKSDIQWIGLNSLVVDKVFVKPTTGRFADGFGYRIDPINGKERFHSGLDLAPGLGARVVAAQGGKVVFADIRAGFGRLIILDHGHELTTWYGHLDEILVKRGRMVKKGELIGRVGKSGRATGPHLHFEVRVKGKPKNPLLYLVQ